MRPSSETVVRVLIPGPDSVPTPVSGLGLVALPYDRDSVLAALEARARTPRPPTAELDTLFAQFRGPFAAYSQAAFEAGRLRDTLAALKTTARQPAAQRSRIPRPLRDLRPAERASSRRPRHGRARPARRSMPPAELREPQRLAARAGRAPGKIVPTRGTTASCAGITERSRPRRRGGHHRCHRSRQLHPSGRALVDLRALVGCHRSQLGVVLERAGQGDTVVLDRRSGRRRPRY